MTMTLAVNHTNNSAVPLRDWANYNPTAFDLLSFNDVLDLARKRAAKAVDGGRLPSCWGGLKPEEATFDDGFSEMGHLSYEEAKPVVTIDDPEYGCGWDEVLAARGGGQDGEWLADPCDNEYDLRLAESLADIAPIAPPGLVTPTVTQLSADAEIGHPDEAVAGPDVGPEPRRDDGWDIPLPKHFGGLERVPSEPSRTSFQETLLQLFCSPGHSPRIESKYSKRRDSLKHREELRRFIGINIPILASMCGWWERNGRYYGTPKPGSVCCQWVGPTQKTGQPRLVRKGYTEVSIRRLVWALCFCQGKTDPLVPKYLSATCGTPNCMNPAHFSARRSPNGVDLSGKVFHGDRRKLNGQSNREKGECRHGHAFLPENTLWVKNTRGSGEQRICKQCRKIQRMAKAEQRGAAVQADAP